MSKYQKALKEAQRLTNAGIKLTEAEKNLLRYLASK